VIFIFILNYFFINNFLFHGDWGLGIGDWGLGIGPNPQSPIPNPQSPIPHPQILEKLNNIVLFNLLKLFIL